MRYSIFTLLFLAFVSCSNQQVKPSKELPPKLIVGVVVDQMRFDYLARFENKFSNVGFKELQNEGFSCNAHHLNFVPTYTGPGHATIFTGRTPQYHGIIGNDWWVNSTGKMTYCVFDSTKKSVGGSYKKEKKSPLNLKVNTLGDWVKLNQDKKGKSIGISIKDRSAILPVGKLADAAYWYKGDKAGRFITSSYYLKKIPSWVEKFNKRKRPDYYLNQEWNTLLPISSYTESGPDDSPYEKSIDPESPPIFPYDLAKIRSSKGYDLMKRIPFGNDLLLEFAIAAIEGEKLGGDSITDFLSISFSSTDYIGHDYGPNSVEVEDAYLRLDANIAQLLNYLDAHIGKDQYLLFLTSDHGASPVPQALIDQGMKGGYYDTDEILREVRSALHIQFGEGPWISTFYNNQFYLNHKFITNQNKDTLEIIRFISDFIGTRPEVYAVYDRKDLEENVDTNAIFQFVKRGWSKGRSGDVVMVMKPNWLPLYHGSKTGTDHGSPWNYDTHIPLFFYGYGIRPGKLENRTEVVDMVPTIGSILGLEYPFELEGEIITEVHR